MNAPRDVSPPSALQENESREISRNVWALRLVGAILLICGWAATSLHGVGSPRFFLATLVFAGLAAYAYTAAAVARRTSVRLERKLRHRLLVHNMELANMAMRDDLTQLFNRRYFFERLERELQSASGRDRPVSVMLIDMDQMKAVNDTYGHRLGDRLLSSFGRFLVSQTRASDIAARIGGDEFAVLLPDTSREAGLALISRITERLDGTSLIEDGAVTLRAAASFGLASYPDAGSTADALMQQADAAMYADKHRRKLFPDPAGAAPETEVPLALRAGDSP